MSKDIKDKQLLATTTKTTTDIKLTDIVVDIDRNCRSYSDPDKQLELKNSMAVNGQITNIEVTKRPDGKYELDVGFRRYAAAAELGWPTIRADVVTGSDGKTLNQQVRRVRNVAENMARSDLSKYDEARAFVGLKEDKLEPKAISAACGVSVSFVNNLIRVWESVEPCIKKRWQMEDAPEGATDKKMQKVCTMDWLTNVATHIPRAEQEMHLQKALGLVTDDGEEGESGRAPQPPGTPKRASMKNLEKALEAATAVLKAAEMSMKGAKGAELQVAQVKWAEAGGVVTALEFATGKTQTIKGYYTPQRLAGQE